MYSIMENKMTKLQIVTMMLANAEISANEVFKAYLENEKALLEKKASNRKATKTQTENVGIKATILTVLEDFNKPMTITDIQSANEDLKALSNQKISALVKQLKDNGLVVKSVEKGKSLFSLAPTDEVEVE